MQEKFDHKIKELFADEKLEHSEAPAMLQNVFNALDKKKKRRGIIWFWLIPGFAFTICITGILIVSSLLQIQKETHQSKTKDRMSTRRISHVPVRSLETDHLQNERYSQPTQATTPVTGSKQTRVTSLDKEKSSHELPLLTNKNRAVINDSLIHTSFIQNIIKTNTDPVSIADTNVVSVENNRNADQPVLPSDSLMEQSIVIREFPVDSELTVLQNPVKQLARVEYFLGFYGSLHFNSINPYTPDAVGPIDREFINKIKNDNFIRQAFDIGLSFKLKRKHFIFETGVCYMRHDFRIDMNNSAFYPNEPIQQDGAYEFLEIPLFFGAQWNFNKWYISPCIGVTSGWLFISENYVYKQGQFELEYQPFRRSGPVLFTPQVKFDVGYTFDKGFSFYISPFFKHHLSGEGGAAYNIPNVVFFSYSFGLRLGFNFNIPRREK